MAAPAILQATGVDFPTSTGGAVTLATGTTAGSALLFRISQTSAGTRNYTVTYNIPGGGTQALTLVKRQGTSQTVEIWEVFNVPVGVTVVNVSHDGAAINFGTYLLETEPVTRVDVDGFDNSVAGTTHYAAAVGKVDTTSDALLIVVSQALGATTPLAYDTGFAQDAVPVAGRRIFYRGAFTGALTDNRALYTSASTTSTSAVAAYRVPAPATYDPWLLADGVDTWKLADGVDDWLLAESIASDSTTGVVTSGQQAQHSDATGVVGASGSASTGQQAQTATLASVEVITGSASTGQQAQSSNATGAEAFAGSATTGQQAQTATLASVQVIAGSATTGGGAQSSNAAGVEVITGVIGSSTPAQTATLASSQVITGSASSGQGAQSSDITGAEVVTGSVTSSTAPQTATLASVEVITGSATTGQGAQSSNLTGASVEAGNPSGAVASGNAAQSSNATGVVGARGAVESSTPPQTATLASTQVISGSATSGQGAQSSDVTATEVIVGAVTTSDAVQTSTLASVQVVSGSAATGGAPESSALTGGVVEPANVISTGQGAQSSSATGMVASTTPPMPGDLPTILTMLGNAAAIRSPVQDVVGSIETANAPQSTISRYRYRVRYPSVVNIADPDTGNAAQSSDARGRVRMIEGWLPPRRGPIQQDVMPPRRRAMSVRGSAASGQGVQESRLAGVMASGDSDEDDDLLLLLGALLSDDAFA